MLPVKVHPETCDAAAEPDVYTASSSPATLFVKTLFVIVPVLNWDIAAYEPAVLPEKVDLDTTIEHPALFRIALPLP